MSQIRPNLLSVVMLNVVMLNVVAPYYRPKQTKSEIEKLNHENELVPSLSNYDFDEQRHDIQHNDTQHNDSQQKGLM